MRADLGRTLLALGALLAACSEDPVTPSAADADASAEVQGDAAADTVVTPDGSSDVEDAADAADATPDTAPDAVAEVTPDVVIPCTSSVECQDQLAPLPECKRAQCQLDGTCALADQPDLTPCDDGNACTTGDRCTAGVCEGGFDQCACTQDADCVALDDGDLCNGIWTCQAGGCAFDPSTVVECGSGDACSDSSCNTQTGACTTSPKPDGTACDDGSVCTTVDLCQAGACVGGVALDCGTPAQCQEAVCDAVDGCSFQDLDEGACDDGDACTANDACSAGSCAGESITCLPSGPCLTAICDSATGCSESPSGEGESCDDDDPCTDTDTCQAGACVGTPTCSCSTAADCPEDPTNKCLEYSCDGGFCTVVPPPTCPQNPNPCVVAECLPSTGQCGLVDLSNGALCDAGASFVGGKCIDGTCQASALDCDDGNPCTVDSCDDTLGCQNLPDQGASCEDGDPCTVDDACNDAGACAGGGANSCDDGDQCTADSCVAGVGCQNVDASACDDGDPCTTDLCIPATGCQHNPKICFGDIEVCLIPTCLQATGECGLGPAPEGFACDDGDACLENESCSAGECVGDVVDCDDGDPCTTDSCESTGGCVNTPLPDCP